MNCRLSICIVHSHRSGHVVTFFSTLIVKEPEPIPTKHRSVLRRFPIVRLCFPGAPGWWRLGCVLVSASSCNWILDEKRMPMQSSSISGLRRATWLSWANNQPKRCRRVRIRKTSDELGGCTGSTVGRLKIYFTIDGYGKCVD